MSNERPRKRFRLSDPPKIENLKDLIKAGREYKFFRHVDMAAVWNILPHLEKLDALIGMEKVKQTIFHQVLYYIQGMHVRDANGEYLHMRIVGPPGTGKTTIAMIIADIFADLGILTGGKGDEKVKLIHRDDFVAGYLGQTAIKTKKLLDSCIGKVVLLDEAYSMGSEREDDSFAKEAIDTLTSFLSEHKNNFCFIVAGYEEDIEKYFFSLNKGLHRRIPWYHKIDPYNPEEMGDIAQKMIREMKWSFSAPEVKDHFVSIVKAEKDLFKHFGGDVENFLSKVKIAHAIRVFTLPSTEKFFITKEDLENGLKKVKEQLPKDSDDLSKFNGMYT